jgi:hypothetical protein
MVNARSIRAALNVCPAGQSENRCGKNAKTASALFAGHRL